jgi:glycosyltransferase involved in cell wall biosynthesis
MIEVTVVLPCLNEEKTIASCVQKAMAAFRQLKTDGEVVVVDNGSTDKSVEIALENGARVVKETRKGYGSALRCGIEEARGEYIVMGDADDTYDFTQVSAFVKRLKEGYELVMGSRFSGNILPGAMTWSHRYIGNPILSGMLRLFFGGSVSDAHCGLRAFTKTAYRKMDLHTTGMEFASEMVIHALKKKLRISEIAITYYPRAGESKLSSLRDAWRHMRFMLIYSPNYLFFFPGMAFFFIGFLLTLRIFFGSLEFMGRIWDTHVMVFSSLSSIIGWQILMLGLAAKTFAAVVGLEEGKWTHRILGVFTLERSIIVGILLFLSGIGLSIYILVIWALTDFGALYQIKTGIVSVTLVAMGITTIFAAFLTSMLQIRYRS